MLKQHLAEVILYFITDRFPKISSAVVSAATEKGGLSARQLIHIFIGL